MTKITEYTIIEYGIYHYKAFRENFPFKNIFHIFRRTELPKVTLLCIKFVCVTKLSLCVIKLIAM